MSLMEVVFCVLLMGVGAGIFSSVAAPLRKAGRNYCELKTEYQRDRFIAESFSSLCSKKETLRQDFEEWEKMCSLTFGLDSICVEKKADTQELKCSWKKGSQLKEIVCVKNM